MKRDRPIDGGHLRPATGLGKLAAPRLGRVFDRERLFSALDAMAVGAGVWIGAPPGAGKTTLLATWLRGRGTPALWFQVEAEDRDPANFARALDMLFSTRSPAGGDVPPFSGDDLTDLGGWLQRRVAHLLELLPPPWCLVFDNVNELPGDSPLHAALAALLGRLPSGVQVLFASRWPPPAAYTSALARQHLLQFDTDLLPMTVDETFELLALHQRPRAIADALAAAQGWPAGLTLMLGAKPPRIALPADAARERLFNYFAAEVMANLPAEQARALERLAYLPRATADMAAHLSGEAGAGAWLEAMAAASMFVERREGQPPVYALHGLFGEFLRRRYAKTASLEALRELLQRAGELLIEAGESDAGLERLAEAEAWDLMASQLTALAPQYLAEGRLMSLQRHLEALPVPLSPSLAFWQALAWVDFDPPRAVTAMQACLQTARAAQDAIGQIAAAAGASAALLAQNRLVDLDPWIEVIDAHTSLLTQPLNDRLAMRLIPGVLGALINRRPWHPLVPPLADRAEQLLELDFAPSQRLLLASLAWHFLWSGQLDRLERIVWRIDGLCHDALAPPVALMRWWGLGILLKVLLGRRQEARGDVQQALALVEAVPMLAPRRSAIELQAMVNELGAGDAVAARRHLERAQRVLDPGNVFDRSALEHQAGMLALLEGDGATAMRQLRAAVQSTARAGWPIREHIALITLALGAAATDAHEEAQAVLKQVYAHPMHAVCPWHQWIGGCVAAYAALRRGDQAEAISALRAAFSVASRCGYRHAPSLFLRPDLMPRLAAMALRLEVEPAVATDLIRRHALPAPVEADDRWPWAVRLRLLGPWQVEIDGQPPTAGRKESRRLLELLRLLVVSGPQPVSLDRLADLLWPDAEGDAARNALDNAVHRLRKMLGGDDRILLREGALQLNPQRCWSDVAALRRLLAAIPQAPVAELPGLVEQIAATCRGPLLPGDDWSPIVEARGGLERLLTRTLDAAALRLRSDGRDADVAAVDAARQTLTASAWARSPPM